MEVCRDLLNSYKVQSILLPLVQPGIPATGEAVAGELQVQGQPEQYSKVLSTNEQ